ncbi:unnamed protein product [Pelagomonas calceolata]|uniref:Uncharacterized protein n=1 Tax=Pelagomonas calceolata TaxID=35677 RepID=A0A8J2SDW9_9STRA|nr:unnamed protein product [Pelagomonas calceolata]
MDLECFVGREGPQAVLERRIAVRLCGRMCIGHPPVFESFPGEASDRAALTKREAHGPIFAALGNGSRARHICRPRGPFFYVDRQKSVGAIDPHAGDEAVIHVAPAHFGARAVRHLNCMVVVAVEQAVDNATNGAAALAK